MKIKKKENVKHFGQVKNIFLHVIRNRNVKHIGQVEDSFLHVLRKCKNKNFSLLYLLASNPSNPSSASHSPVFLFICSSTSIPIGYPQFIQSLGSDRVFGDGNGFGLVRCLDLCLKGLKVSVNALLGPSLPVSCSAC